MKSEADRTGIRRFLIFLVIFSCACEAQSADTIFLNGTVLTMTGSDDEVRAFAVEDEVIIDVGSDEALRNRYPDAAVVDFGGAVVMPGIIESHGHMLNLGLIAMRVDLQDVSDPDDVVRLLKDRVASVPEGEWIVGWGWDDGAWTDQMADISDELNGATTGHPVWLAGLHGFNGWANQVALDLAGVTGDTPDPDGGRIFLHPETGRPSGILANHAMALVTDIMPALSMDQRKRAFELAGEELLRNGLTSVHEANIFREDLEALRSLKGKGSLKVRYNLMLSCTDPELIAPFLAHGPEIDPDHWLTIRTIKVFQDGSLGTRSALMLEPYSDAPGVLGVSTTPPDELEDLTKRALRAGLQVATHAIGDRSNRVTLDAYQAAIEAVPEAGDHRLRIEHAQVMTAEDIPRFAEMGIIASMSPPHATSDMAWAEDRVGPERILGAYAWRDFLDVGVHLPLNSDFPGEELNPFLGMYAAETRQTFEGHPTGGWYPDQRLTREESLRGYLFEGAYAAFEEDLKGAIAPGMLADFIVVSDDVRAVPAVRLLDLEVLQTWVGGKLVYPED